MGGNLFAQAGAEYLESDIGALWDRIWDDLDPAYPEEGDTAQWEILEWSARPLGTMLTPTWRTLERISEDLYDEVNEYGMEHVDAAIAKTEVIAAFDYARALLARHLSGFSMADRHIATHIITLDEHDQPLVNGEPMYITKEAGSA